MFDLALHSGLDHPNVWWILVPSLLSLLAGLFVGVYADRLRSLLETRTVETPE